MLRCPPAAPIRRRQVSPWGSFHLDLSGREKKNFARKVGSPGRPVQGLLVGRRKSTSLPLTLPIPALYTRCVFTSRWVRCCLPSDAPLLDLSHAADRFRHWHQCARMTTRPIQRSRARGGDFASRTTAGCPAALALAFFRDHRAIYPGPQRPLTSLRPLQDGAGRTSTADRSTPASTSDILGPLRRLFAATFLNSAWPTMAPYV